jgi:predicted Ser/Thr protein kinase
MVEAANISQCFTYQDIVTATGNFSTILGKGGFAMVYKGTLKNGTTDIAVKVLSDASKRGVQQFLTEVINIMVYYSAPKSAEF